MTVFITRTASTKPCPLLFLVPGLHRGGRFSASASAAAAANVRRFHCSFCSYSTIYKQTLQRHHRTHTGERPFECEFCLKTFAQKCNMKAHQRLHVGACPYRCQFCHLGFSRRELLTEHLQHEHALQLAFKCGYCSGGFLTRHELWRHLRTCTPWAADAVAASAVSTVVTSIPAALPTSAAAASSPTTTCPSAAADMPLGASVGVPGAVPRSPLAGMQRRLFRCSRCSFSTVYKCSLIVHQRTHTGERPFQCRLCSRTFAHKCNLKSHLRVHTGERPYRCPLCPHSFTQRGAFTAHIHAHHGAALPSAMVQQQQPAVPTVQRCSLCPSLFNLPEELRAHMQQQSKCLWVRKTLNMGERPFAARPPPVSSALKSRRGQCGLRDQARRAAELIVEATNSADFFFLPVLSAQVALFRCSYCPYQSVRRHTLKLHERTHTGERPFKCDLCERRFVQRTHLMTHRYRHRPATACSFFCPECNLHFSTKKHFDDHWITHNTAT
ncbi:uncharacterized protein LOC144108331 [Amblyomma americanum]